MRPTRINFYLYIRAKRYLTLLKMAEEFIGNLGYETLQSDTKHDPTFKLENNSSSICKPCQNKSHYNLDNLWVEFSI